MALNQTFNYKEALQQSGYHEFVKAMVHEVNNHETQNHWTFTKRCDLLPGTKTILSIWSFKRKQYPDRALNKHKAQLCAHGGMQMGGQNYWETYAPVVNWVSVRIFLAIAKKSWPIIKKHQFCFSFSQADLEITVYMELPLGFDARNNKS